MGIYSAEHLGRRVLICARRNWGLKLSNCVLVNLNNKGLSYALLPCTAPVPRGGFQKGEKVSRIISCLSSPGSFLCFLAKISEKGVTNLLCVANVH